MIKQTDSERIDKFLWSVRLFKTRNDAKKACEGGKITLNGQKAKPSKTVEAGDKIEVTQAPITKSFQIKTVISNRVGAKLVPEVLEDLTPAEELDKLKAVKRNFVQRDRGAGRPTKKERRDIEDFLSDPKF
jgi:ribosome-associated heat shock protein Hsp15